MDESRLVEIPTGAARSDVLKVYTDHQVGEEMNSIVNQMGLQADAFAGPAWVTLIYFGLITDLSSTFFESEPGYIRSTKKEEKSSTDITPPTARCWRLTAPNSICWNKCQYS